MSFFSFHSNVPCRQYEAGESERKAESELNQIVPKQVLKTKQNLSHFNNIENLRYNAATFAISGLFYHWSGSSLPTK